MNVIIHQIQVKIKVNKVTTSNATSFDSVAHLSAIHAGEQLKGNDDNCELLLESKAIDGQFAIS